MRKLADIIETITCNGARELTEVRIKQIIEEYHDEQWISAQKELPEVGLNVIVVTEFLNKEKLSSEMFVGYLGEDGDLYSIPEDENYGWSFKECVTFWRPIPQSPNH